MAEEDFLQKLRVRCHDQAFHAYGYKFIFDERKKRYDFYLTMLKVFGLLVPATFGTVVVAYGLKSRISEVLLSITIALSICQFVFSVLAVILKWDDRVIYAIEASQAYNGLYTRYKSLGEFPPATYEELRGAYDPIFQENDLRSNQDTAQNIAGWEERKGMRFSLREHKRPCQGCGNTPLSMESINCYVCGNFSINHQYKILLWLHKLTRSKRDTRP
jgi:mobilome CxxCx(11)CxxC protein